MEFTSLPFARISASSLVLWHKRCPHCLTIFVSRNAYTDVFRKIILNPSRLQYQNTYYLSYTVMVSGRQSLTPVPHVHNMTEACCRWREGKIVSNEQFELCSHIFSCCLLQNLPMSKRFKFFCCVRYAGLIDRCSDVERWLKLSKHLDGHHDIASSSRHML